MTVAELRKAREILQANTVPVKPGTSFVMIDPTGCYMIEVPDAEED
jgi:hypothetical protein